MEFLASLFTKSLDVLLKKVIDQTLYREDFPLHFLSHKLRLFCSIQSEMIYRVSQKKFNRLACHGVKSM